MNRKALEVTIIGAFCISIVIVAVVIIALSFNNSRLSNDERTLASLKKIDDYPLFIMTFYGDYGFEEYLKSGITPTEKPLEKYHDVFSIITQKRKWACTCFSTLNPSADFMLFGRNFDWITSPKLLLFTSPSNGYASYTMVDLEMLGFETEDDIIEASQEASQEELGNLLKAPYFTLDGMNDQGLAVGCMAVPRADNIIIPGKVTLSSLDYLRLALDFAKNVEEALALWTQYNVYFPPGPPLHYLITDAGGNSAIVEFVEGKMEVLWHKNFWQVATNFIVYNSSEVEQNYCWRYTTAERTLNESNGDLTMEEAMNLLETVAQSITQWSAVYNIHTGEILIAMGRKYDQIHSFNLPLANSVSVK